jgi:hypothetical protein
MNSQHIVGAAFTFVLVSGCGGDKTMDSSERQFSAVETCLAGKGYSVDRMTTRAEPGLTVSWARGGVTQASIIIRQFPTEATARAYVRGNARVAIRPRQMENFVIAPDPADETVGAAIAECVEESPSHDRR